MNDNDLCSGFRKRLKQYDDLEVKADELNEKYSLIEEQYRTAFNTLDFLKANSFRVDTKLIKYVADKKEEVSSIKISYDYFAKLMNELNIGNFRNVVFCLSKELGLTLEELAEKLECSNKNVLSTFCTSGNINKKDFLKVCTYFKLNEKNRRYIRYCDVFKKEIN